MADEDNNEQNSQPTASEVEARKFGWVSKDEFKGDESQWRDADAFLQRGKEINGFLRNDLAKLETAHRKEIEDIQKSVKQLTEFYQESNKKAYQRAVDDLKKAKAVAITEGDGERVTEIEEQIEKVKEASQTAEKPQENQSPQQNDREYYDWLKENPWYITNKDMISAGEKFGELIHADEPNLKGRAFLDKITARVKEAFPDEFENPNRQTSSVSSSSDGRNPNPKAKKRSYEALPPEAKKHCDDFVKRGWVTKEEYVRDYDWSE